MKQAGPGEVRIIGGQWKRSTLNVRPGPGLRPTPGRVRETLFNWLGQDLRDWRVLDAFAGSGALGLESASRGACDVWLIESQPQHAQQLRQTVQRLKATQVQVVCGDALHWMSQAPRQHFDLILLDPPFAQHLAPQALNLAAPCVKPHGWIYLESDHALTPTMLPKGWCIHRQGRAASVHFHLLHATEHPATLSDTSDATSALEGRPSQHPPPP